MTTATKTAPVENKNAPPKPPRGGDEITRILEECNSLRAAYTKGLAFLAEKFDSPYAALTLDADNGSIQEEVKASEQARKAWIRHCDGMMLSSRYHQTSQARFFKADGVDRTLAVLSVPLTNKSDGAVGAIAIVVPCQHKEVAEARLSELRATVSIIDIQAESARQRKRPAADTSSLAKVASHQNLEEFCFTLTNSLKTNLQCDQVSLGLVRGKSVKVACVSGFDDIYPRSPGTQIIRHAMNECLDADDIVCYQTDSETKQAATGHHLHRQWHSWAGNCPVASIPLEVDEHCVAIVSLRNPEGQPFRNEQLRKVQSLVNPMMPGLLLIEQANRSASQRARESFGEFIKQFVRPGSLHRKLFAIAALAVMGWVIFGKTNYQLAAPCTVESTDDLQLSAPFEEAIAESYVLPGDTVQKGQPVARLDTRSLESEKKKLLSDARLAKVNILRAAQAGDVAAASQSRAEMESAKAQIGIIDHKIAAATIRAPADGIILEGRLDSRIGEVVGLGEPLFRFAPKGRWKLKVHVPDHSAAELEKGQVVNAAISARPEVSNPLKIVSLQASSEVQDGKNVFHAEAEFDGEAPEWVRAGMRGVARVDIGRRPVWWVWAHHTIDSIRLQFWKF